MNKKTIISLFVTLSAIAFSSAYANRPADFEAPSSVEEAPAAMPQDESRPAATDFSPPAQEEPQSTTTEFTPPFEDEPVTEPEQPTTQFTSPFEEAPEPVKEDVVRTEVQTQGDVLQTPVQAQPQAVRQLDFPRRGMTQDKVQNELGRPIEIVPAVGQPPISQWVYDDRVVYFEFSSVIHVVAR